MAIRSAQPVLYGLLVALLVPTGMAIDLPVLGDEPRDDPLVDLDGPVAGAEQEGDLPGDDGPGIGERVRDSLADQVLWTSAIAVGVAAIGLTGFALVTRYVSPKEALKNPQRAMLYGFVRATPGAHLKQLSEEFAMKTSSILWHIRKLESADLVRSERANGFRVFYPVEGGVEIKRLSRAITALHNENARRIHAAIQRTPGAPVKDLAQRLNVHPGTVRWHVRKLREFGLVEELVREDASQFFPTPLGTKALQAVEGRPTTDSAPTATPTD